MNTIHDTSIRKVLLSAHARDLRWAKFNRIADRVVSVILWPLAVCALPKKDGMEGTNEHTASSIPR